MIKILIFAAVVALASAQVHLPLPYAHNAAYLAAGHHAYSAVPTAVHHARTEIIAQQPYTVQNAPVITEIHEPVEQHGYKISF